MNTYIQHSNGSKHAEGLNSYTGTLIPLIEVLTLNSKINVILQHEMIACRQCFTKQYRTFIHIHVSYLQTIPITKVRQLSFYYV